jgi:hypothetical protein
VLHVVWKIEELVPIFYSVALLVGHLFGINRKRVEGVPLHKYRNYVGGEFTHLHGGVDRHMMGIVGNHMMDNLLVG